MADRDLTELATAIGRMAEQVGRLDERAEARHGNMCSRLASMEAAVEAVRQAQVDHGLAVAGLQSTCAQRGENCGQLHRDLRSRSRSHSSELDSLRERLSLQEDKTLRLDETSQVTHVAELERRAREAFRKRLLKACWRVGWKVVIVLGGLGLLGGGTAALLAAMK